VGDARPKAIAVAQRTTPWSASERGVGWHEQPRRLQPACYCGSTTGLTWDACTVTREHHGTGAKKKGVIRGRQGAFNRQVRRTAFLTVGLGAALVSGSSCWSPATGSPGRSTLPRRSSVWPGRYPSFANSAAKSPCPRHRGTSQLTDEAAFGRHGRVGLQPGAIGAAAVCPPLSHSGTRDSPADPRVTAASFTKQQRALREG
jgi:hypothetical protein